MAFVACATAFRMERLAAGFGHALGVEAETRKAYEEEGQADDGQEKLNPALECEDFGLKFELVHSQNLGGHDGALATANPACGRGARHTEVTEQLWVTLFLQVRSRSRWSYDLRQEDVGTR